ncbi:MAG: hypothetical protein ACRYFL_14295, partial [Janthinobacterium lividum]
DHFPIGTPIIFYIISYRFQRKIYRLHITFKKEGSYYELDKLVMFKDGKTVNADEYIKISNLLSKNFGKEEAKNIK